MIALKVRLMTHPMKTLTKLVNDVRRNTELPEYLKLSVGKKRFTKEQLADHLVKLHKTKFFNGNAIKKLTTAKAKKDKKEVKIPKKIQDKIDKATTKEELLKIQKEYGTPASKKDKKKLPPITDKEIANLPAPPKELLDKPKKKVKFNVVKNNGNPWIAHVRAYAKENNMKYNEALEFASKTYKKK